MTGIGPIGQLLTPAQAASLDRQIGGGPSGPRIARALEALTGALFQAARRDYPLDRLLQRLVSVCEASDFLPRILAARPQLIPWLAGSRTLEAAKTSPRFSVELASKLRRVSVEDLEGAMRTLRRYKYRELFRLSVRETSQILKPDELGAELTSLADSCVSAALSFARASLGKKYGEPLADREGFSVLALGKLGGEDLNFSSDIDLLYLYRSDGDTSGGEAGSIPNVNYYRKLGETLTRLLTTATSEGFCFRVDLNLRPHGRVGPIALSLAQTLAYYEGFGRTWERAALIKLRHLAGDAKLSKELIDGIAPFVWRRAVDQSVVENLRQMRMQIASQGKVNPLDLKLGAGGIREIEFFVSGLQLLHGGKQPRLRERNTVRALRQLEQAGMLSGPDADRMEAAYHWLRKIENRLQMVDERQTHALPIDAGDQERLAYSLGYGSWTPFEQEASAHREFVANAFEETLGLTVRGEIRTNPLLATVVDPQTSDERRLSALSESGFTSAPTSSLNTIERLQRLCATTGVGGESHALELLNEVAASADPDQALIHLSEFLSALSSPRAYLELLRERPLLRRQLINLFAQTDLLARYFVGHPELIDQLLQSGLADVRKGPRRIREELTFRLSRHQYNEERLGSMRRFKNEETLRIALNDISGDLTVSEVSAELTAIADGLLDECLAMVNIEMRERYGEPRGPDGTETLAVIGMGKLGGIELGYHSDVDLIFVYSGAGETETSGGSRGGLTHHEYFAKAAQRLLALLHMRLREGFLYQVDTRLRPSGNKGTLVVSAQTLRDYHQRYAQLWERQALTKARGCAGDLGLFAEIQKNIIHPLVYLQPLPGDTPQQIDRLRQRMEREISGENTGGINAKTGHGGMVDVEFLTQYLQMLHGREFPTVRETSTVAALNGLREAGVLNVPRHRIVTEGYRFLRQVENRLRLLAGYSKSHLPADSQSLQKLARLLGYLGPNAGREFMQDYRQCTDEIRAIYGQLMRATPTPS